MHKDNGLPNSVGSTVEKVDPTLILQSLCGYFHLTLLVRLD